MHKHICFCPRSNVENEETCPASNQHNTHSKHNFYLILYIRNMLNAINFHIVHVLCRCKLLFITVFLLGFGCKGVLVISSFTSHIISLVLGSYEFFFLLQVRLRYRPHWACSKRIPLVTIGCMGSGFYPLNAGCFFGNRGFSNSITSVIQHHYSIYIFFY